MGIIKRVWISWAGAVLFTIGITSSVYAESRVQTNVIYGMYSGLALLMDVHTPQQPNGYGVVLIPGSAWSAPLSLDAAPLKLGTTRSVLGVDRLLAAGYSVFAINHRAAPRFTYPAAVADSQRAVRYIRHHAELFGIKADRIGAVGGSSGGYLVSMLGALNGDENTSGLTPVDQESAKVQAVVALYPATDLTAFAKQTGGSNALMSLYMGAYLGAAAPTDPTTDEAVRYAAASPTSHISPDDPPFLLVHGDADKAVPFAQSEILFARLKENGVTTHFITMPGGGHGADLLAGPNPPDHYGPMIDWLDRHLRQRE
jgi:acetyl esterase/lipase